MQNDEADIIGKAAFHPELSVIDMNDPDQYRARKRRRHSPDALDRPLTNLILVNRSSNGTGDSFTNPTGLSGSEGFASKLWGGDSLEQNPSSQATHSGALDGADSNATPFWCFGMVNRKLRRPWVLDPLLTNSRSEIFREPASFLAIINRIPIRFISMELMEASLA